MKNSKQLEIEDRISKLPDDLLCHILSFLPTKFAASTSVLSTRWTHLFNSIPNVDLDDSLISHPRQSICPISEDKFSQFVFKILRTSNSIIFKFRLNCRRMYDDSVINEWLLLVLLRNVRELDFCGKFDESGSLPDEIFMCKTLEVLKFGFCFVFNVPENVNLPNLRVLCLRFIRLTDSVRRVFSGCPVLEDLSIISCRMVDVVVFEISVPSLKNLKLSYCFGEYDVTLDTPNLQRFVYNRQGGQVCSVKNKKSLVSLALSWGLPEGHHIEEFQDLEQATKFVNAMHNVKSLYLTDTSISALYSSPCALSMFRHLTYMELGATHTCGWLILPDLLASSPNLEVLVFADGFIDYDGFQTKEFEYLLPESVPVCLSRCLREIKIGKFDAQECEFELIEYFLKSAQVLRKLVIGYEVSSESPYGSKKRLRNVYKVPPQCVSPICERLSTVPRRSKTCQVLLYWKNREKLCSRILN